MSRITAQQIRMAAKGPVNDANMHSVLLAIDRYGDDFGMNRLCRLVQYLAQLMHESGEFRYDREVWGPTAAQKKYDTRTDLGNTAAIDGDGKKYMGRTGTQVTGLANYEAYHAWCEEQGYNPPDFVKEPDLVNTDPWEGLAPLWYWQSRNLNRWADQGDAETISRKINGGVNGLADRLDHVVRLSLVVLGLGPTAIEDFQRQARADGIYSGDIDNDAGPKTRAALQAALIKVDGLSHAQGFVSSPITEKVAVAVTPASLDAPWWKSKEVIVPVVTGGGLTGGLAAVGQMPWQNLALVLLALGAAGGFLYWRKHSDAKAVKAVVEG